MKLVNEISFLYISIAFNLVLILLSPITVAISNNPTQCRSHSLQEEKRNFTNSSEENDHPLEMLHFYHFLLNKINMQNPLHYKKGCNGNNDSVKRRQVTISNCMSQEFFSQCHFKKVFINFEIRNLET